MYTQLEQTALVALWGFRKLPKQYKLIAIEMLLDAIGNDVGVEVIEEIERIKGE